MAYQRSDSSDRAKLPPQDCPNLVCRHKKCAGLRCLLKYVPAHHPCQSKRFVHWLQDPVWAIIVWMHWAQMGHVSNKHILRCLPTNGDTHLRDWQKRLCSVQKSTTQGPGNCSAVTGNALELKGVDFKRTQQNTREGHFWVQYGAPASPKGVCQPSCCPGD